MSVLPDQSTFLTYDTSHRSIRLHSESAAKEINKEKGQYIIREEMKLGYKFA